MQTAALDRITVDGLEIGYRELGDGPPVLLLHGWPTASYLWRDVMPAIARANRVIAPDLPGFGASDKPAGVAYDFDLFEGAIDGLLEALGVDRLGLAVHDLGGPIGLHWTVRNPERVTRLALLNTLVYPQFAPSVIEFVTTLSTPGKREQEYKQDVEMVRRNFGGLRQVTIVNPKGGAGKTVAVLLLAMTFGQKRGGYVLAWDNNETQGTLGMRAQQDFHARTVRDMMRDLHLFRGAHGRVGDLSQYVRAQGEGMFDVLASDESATAGEMLTAGAFAEIREIVSRFYKLIFVDTGNNVRAQNWQAAIDATDQLVITMSARNDSAETAARMLDHLEQSGRQRLVRQAVSVVTMPPTRKDIDLPAIQRHFAARTRAVLMAPYEKLIDSGEPLRYGQLSANTKDAWLKIAAAVAEGL